MCRLCLEVLLGHAGHTVEKGFVMQRGRFGEFRRVPIERCRFRFGVVPMTWIVMGTWNHVMIPTNSFWKLSSNKTDQKNHESQGRGGNVLLLRSLKGLENYTLGGYQGHIQMAQFCLGLAQMVVPE